MSMNAYVSGEPVRLSATFAKLAGVDTDATITLHIRTPDGTETDYSGSVVHDGTGQYHCDFTTTLGGDHFARWAASGALVAAYEEQFYVLRTAF